MTTTACRPRIAARARRSGVAALTALCLACAAPGASAQADNDDPGAAAMDDTDVGGARLSVDEARRVLAQPLADEPNVRYQLLQRQRRAAQLLDDRVRIIDTLRQLVDEGRGRAGGEAWIVAYLNAEFIYGSQGRALEACEPFISDPSLSPATRASVALRQTYFAAQGNDRAIVERYWSRADRLSAEVVRQGVDVPTRMPADRLQVRSEIERWGGDLTGSLTTLREAIGIGRRDVAAARDRHPNEPRDPDRLDSYSMLDGSYGMLVYALVRQGRSQEAIEVSRANIALWRSAQLSDALGARWNYRLATGLNATRQYAPALDAARLSDEMLQRAGASTASHTRWLARQEIVRALIGLKRWKEADETYRGFLADMPPDVLARTRASDWRLLALLAAKNGRLDEALDVAERNHRYRLRLYGAHHPQTREAAGVRAVVRLMRGETSLAMVDYEELFAGTLDNAGGWLDLDLRGTRGFVFGVAFDEYMRSIAERALRGDSIDAAQTDRALQIADRNNLGSTQQALTDSTARVLAATPALRALLEQEQGQRRVASQLFAQVFSLTTQEDALRREAQGDPAKPTPPEADRRATQERLRSVREQIKVQQVSAAAARELLTTLRESISRQFPAYADLVTPTTPRPEALRKLLGSGEALLVIEPTENATLVWLVRADGRGSFTASRLTTDQLAQRVAEIRTMLDLGSASPGKAPVLQPALLNALYRDLLGPQEAGLKDVRSLIVATHGPLASLPLAALVTRPPDGATPPAWLARQMAVTQLPASSSLLSLRRVAQPAVAGKALMGFGDPLFKLADAAPPAAAKPGRTAAPAARPPATVGAVVSRNAGAYDAEWGFRYRDVPPLPETRTELLAVADALGADPATDLVLGAQATRRAVLDADLLDRRVVAFATHGMMPGDLPGISKPALAMAATRDERESPLLELDDVLGLRLNAQWVLLSACNTAAGEQGGDAMSGLVRGFFFAGARSVLATHWAVESESAAALSAATFRAQATAGASRAESLRQAQLAMIDGQLGNGRWTHPFYWAPYALFGDPVR